jgi:NADH dehydrogenase [ubiquinone] 1 alpha subcomplex assembly factor 5
MVIIESLSRRGRRRTSARVSSALFDLELRALRRDRAARLGADPFLLDRAFEDCVERLGSIRKDFSSALLVGCANPAWAERVRNFCGRVDAFDPGRLFAERAHGRKALESGLPVVPGDYDLCIAIGTLDTVNDLPDVLLRLRLALEPDALLIGAMAGGNTLPMLRSAMRAADEAMGRAAPHVHPRIDPPALANLLSSAGFAMPVVDIDRVKVSYGSFLALVRDLRAMAATNVLRERGSTSLSRSALLAAERSFVAAGAGGRTLEEVEILHFAAWTPARES